MHAQLYATFKKDEPPVGIILNFREDYFFLSNFFLAEVDGYPATENAYMAWKTTSGEFRAALQEMTPPTAKRFSKTPEFIATHRADYSDETRVACMLELVRKKFFLHRELGDRLLATGDAALIEGNTWGDVLFGFDMRAGKGQNWLGRILMQVRDELRVAREKEGA